MKDVEIRCECSARPILGIFRVEDSYWVFHIKVHKQKRLYAELMVEEGVIRLRCRACERWFRLTVKREKNLKSPPIPEDSSTRPLPESDRLSYLANSDAHAPRARS